MCASQRQLSGVKKKKKKRLYCGNATGTIRIVLWEKKKKRKKLAVHRKIAATRCCYKIADVPGKEFQEKRYLSVPEKGTIEHIDDIDDVAKW